MGITEELRWTAAKLMNVGKFAVDSAVSQVSLQVYAAVIGKLEDQPSSAISKKKNLVVEEEMQAKLEKLQRDKNNIQHQCTISTEEKEHLKDLFDEPQPLKSAIPEVTAPKKIFIRSRL